MSTTTMIDLTAVARLEVDASILFLLSILLYEHLMILSLR